MKILHTADWHIGKKLHKYELHEDINIFVDWLFKLIQKHEIDLLLVSGDVFDLANPSADARSQYYNALLTLSSTGCQLIITGGNHDSSHMLNAPKELLKQLRIHVIGGLPENVEDVLIPIYKNEILELVVAAVPFLRDGDVRKAAEGLSYEGKIEEVQKGMEKVYSDLGEICNSTYKNVPAIAMGHLYTAGASTSESERDIQIGNQAMFHSSRFDEAFEYIALGHIHKPQKISSDRQVYYSGSPIPLSFSERSDRKRVLLLDTEKGFEPESIEIPSFRKLLRIVGSLNEIAIQLDNLQEETDLTSLVEIHLTETHHNVERIMQLDQLINDFDHPNYTIIHRTIQFDDRLNGTGQFFDQKTSLEELSPMDVFKKMIEDREYDEETEKGLQLAFQELHEEVLQKEEK